MKFNHIKQKHNWDCCIASIAMMSGNTYASVLKKFKELYPRHRKEGLTDPEISKLMKCFMMKPKFVSIIVLNLPALLFLPSKNDDDGFHAVYFDGREIFDPNHKIEGKKYYGTKIPKIFPNETEAVIDMNHPLAKEVLKLIK